MKTIFITVFQGIEFRNLIRTQVYQELIKRPEVRLVLLTDSEAKRSYFEGEFHAHNVVYEVIDNYQPHWSAPLFSFLKFNLIKTSSLDMKRRRELLENRNYPKYFLKLVFNRLFARRLFRLPVRWAAFYLVNDRAFEPYFNTYRPNLVVSAHPFSDIETALIREAKRRGIPVIEIIASWDKLTSRNMILILPEKLIVPNEIVKSDARRLADIAEDKIVVSGWPIFDFHFTSRRSSKEEFARRAGLDPNKRYLVFCPEGKTFINSDGEMAALLDELIASGELPPDLQLIIRLPPNDTIDLRSYKTNVVVQRAGKRFSKGRGVDWDMDENDFVLLADTLFHSSVVIQYASTIALEAAIFDKPILSVNIPFSQYSSIDWIYKYDQSQDLLKSNAIRKVYSKSELVEWINRYLEKPELDREKREELRQEQCFKLDGRAGNRVSQHLLAAVELPL